jgi:hypothetical protein
MSSSPKHLNVGVVLFPIALPLESVHQCNADLRVDAELIVDASGLLTASLGKIRNSKYLQHGLCDNADFLHTG